MQKYLVYLLLIFTFSLRFMAPVFAGFQYATAEQQEEKFDLKLVVFELEETDKTFQQGIPVLCIRLFSIPNLQGLILPVQYFSIPTPPPWSYT